MNEPKVIQAVFYNWRPIVGHKRLQLIFEVPLEDTNIVLKMLGAPMPDKETWCAIALLERDRPAAASANAKAHRAFHTLPAVQQAAIKCKDTDFQVWINGGWASEQDCAAAVRYRCGVDSRADLLPGTEAERLWNGLLSEYEGIR
jgi:hypothetical protein